MLFQRDFIWNNPIEWRDAEEGSLWRQHWQEENAWTKRNMDASQEHAGMTDFSLISRTQVRE